MSSKEKLVWLGSYYPEAGKLSCADLELEARITDRITSKGPNFFSASIILSAKWEILTVHS